MNNTKKLLGSQTTTTTDNRDVFTFPQKCIENSELNVSEQRQRQIINEVCENLSEMKNPSSHQKSLCIFGLVYDKYEEIQKDKQQKQTKKQ